MMKQVIDWFEIPVQELKQACRFYESVLQTKLKSENYAGPSMQMAVFTGEGDVVKGALVEGNSALQVGVSGTLVFLHVDESLDTALKRVVLEGGKIAMNKTALPEGLGFMAHILDTDGNRVGLHSNI